MSGTYNRAVVDDHREVLEHLVIVGIVPKRAPPQMLSLIKRTHTLTYSLMLWAVRLQGLPKHSKPFVGEIASDALQILPHIMMGYRKPTKILIRGVLENTLRYIYYSEHPIEFAILNREKQRYMSVDELVTYVKKHPNHEATEPHFAAINKLQTLYGELSAGIHGRRVVDLETRKALEAIKFNAAYAAAEVDTLRKVVEVANFLLAIENQMQLRNFPSADRSTILRTLPQPARALWQDFQGKLDDA